MSRESEFDHEIGDVAMVFAFCDKTINNSKSTRLLFSVISDTQRYLKYSSPIVLRIKYVFLIKIMRDFLSEI